MHDKFGFGGKRLEKLVDEIHEIIEAYNDGYINANCGCEKKHDDCGHGHGKPDVGCGCHKPERPEKPDCTKPDNPEIRCGVETGWKPETGWCYPYAK